METKNLFFTESLNTFRKVQSLLRDYEVLSGGKKCFILITSDYIEFNEGVLDADVGEFVFATRLKNIEAVEKHLEQEIKKIVDAEKIKERQNFSHRAIDLTM